MPAHEYGVRDSASRLRALRRILTGKPDRVNLIRPTIFFFFSSCFLWKKAYMPNDANHISNPKDR